jgi:hypothetical protein
LVAVWGVNRCGHEVEQADKRRKYKLRIWCVETVGSDKCELSELGFQPQQPVSSLDNVFTMSSLDDVFTIITHRLNFQAIMTLLRLSKQPAAVAALAIALRYMCPIRSLLSRMRFSKYRRPMHEAQNEAVSLSRMSYALSVGG